MYNELIVKLKRQGSVFYGFCVQQRLIIKLLKNYVNTHCTVLSFSY